VNNTAACNDGDACTLSDRCNNGACEGPTARICDDSNVCTDDACNPASGCTFTPTVAGTSCDDGNTCTLSDRCNNGACEGPTARICNDNSFCTQDSCDPVSGCVYTPTPLVDCRTAANSMLVIKQGTSDAEDELVFEWIDGSVTPAELGDPLTSTGYELCVFDADGILVDGNVPPGGTCGTKPCWKKHGASGFKFTDADAANDGIERITLRGDVSDPKAKVLIDGKGSNLPDPVQPVTEPITAQVVNTVTGLCFEATFSGLQVLSNDADELRCEAP
jgi:hypothetical protein